MTRDCKNCDQPIDSRGRAGGRGRPPIFCSHECKEAWRSHTQKAERALPLAAVVCVTCGKTFKASSKKHRNCSPKCSEIYQNHRRKYSTPKAYAELLAFQGGRCAICCSKEPGGRGERFHNDHRHGTTEVRGLLCNKCNIGLGYFNDDPESLDLAALYLRKGPQQRFFPEDSEPCLTPVPP